MGSTVFLCNFFIPFLFDHASWVRGYPKDNYSRSGRKGYTSRTGPILNNLSAIDSLPFGASDNDLRGYFFAGMLSAAPGQVIDDGEVYQDRTARDFANSYTWRKTSRCQISRRIPSFLPR
jgi:hypothetical protein